MNAMTVGARAVAGGDTDIPCIVTLKTGVNGIAHTAATISMPGCTVQDSGTMSETGTSFDVRGVAGSPDGSVYVKGTCSGCAGKVLPAANLHTSTGVSYSDPLSQVPTPWDAVTDPCTAATAGQVNTTMKNDTQGHSYMLRSISRYTTGGTTLQPGIYCGGIGIGGGGVTTTSTGIYILYGAPGSHSSFQTNTSGTMNATTPPPEVMFYATGAPAASASAWKFPDQKMLDINPSGTANLKAIRSGPWAGILFFQDRTWASGNNSQVTGGGSTNLEGIIYIQNTSSTDPTIRFSGGSGGSWVTYTLLIVPSMTFTGGSTLKNNAGVLSGGAFVDTKLAE